MSVVVYAVLLCITGVVASALAVLVEGLIRTHWFRVTGIAVFLLLIILMFSEFRAAVVARGTEGAASDFIIVIFAVLMTAACWMLFFATMVAGTVANVVRNVISLDAIRIPPPFSLVDAAIAQKNYPLALTRLLGVVRDYPEESEPLRRLGDLYQLMDRPGEAVEAYRRAQAIEPEPAEKLLHVFSASEVLADRLRDLPSALAEIRNFLERYPEVKGRDYAEDRMARLRERMTGAEGTA